MARCHQDFWELEESSTGEAALSRLGSGTGMWPLSSVGNCKEKKLELLASSAVDKGPL